MPKVVFQIGKEKKEVEVAEGANLRDAAIKAGIQVNFEVIDTPGGLLGRVFNCHGLGFCGTCRVLVKKGAENLAPKGTRPEQWKQLHEKVAAGQAKAGRTLPERITIARMLSAIGYEDEMRLACQVQVYGDCTVETRPTANLSGENFWQKPYPNK